MDENGYKERFKSVDWERTVMQLLRYCTYIFGKHGKRPGQMIGRAFAIEDVVSEAIEAVLSGRRRWEPDRGDLLPFLTQSVIRGIKFNIGRASENSILEYLDVYRNGEGRDLPVPRQDESLRIPSAEHIALNQEDYSGLLSVFLDTVSDLHSEEAEHIFRCICDGIFKPRDIEAATGIPARRISEVKRQLLQKLKGVYNEYEFYRE